MKLASAERIIKVEPITGADLIEKATVLGWEIVIKKEEFKPGDLAGYIQIDTIVPEVQQFEFLRERKFRVRTIKLRNQISQGLLVPLPAGDWKEGDDLTETLGVKKHSKDIVLEALPPIPKIWYKKWWFIFRNTVLVKLFPGLKASNRNSFPRHLVPVTDEERIQNMPRVLDTYKDREFVVSEKLDGSSITIIYEKKPYKNARFRICSRKLELSDKNNDWYRAFISTGFSKHMLNLVSFYGTPNVIVQGEVIGTPQGNKYQLKENEIRLFNIYVDGKRILQDEFYRVCNELAIPCCPLIGHFKLEQSLPELIHFAEGKSIINKKTEREGLVYRSVSDGLSFKVISNKYLLKNQE